MEYKNIQVCIIDDCLPFQKLGFDIDESKLIDGKIIEPLAKINVEWPNEPYLHELSAMILSSKYYKSANIILKWALHPSFCINSVKQEMYHPELIIFDWEFLNYKSLNRSKEDESFKVADELKEMLDLLPDAFFFVYSNVASQIPIYLFKKELDKYAKRFQVLPKGNHNLILSSEELIYDYILLYLDNKPCIRIGDQDIRFDKSKYLENYKDILHLEFILGRESLKSELEKNQNEISDKTVRQMLQNFEFKLFLSKDNHILISEDTDIYKKNFGPLTEITYVEVFEKYGLQALSGVLNDSTFKL